MFVFIDINPAPHQTHPFFRWEPFQKRTFCLACHRGIQASVRMPDGLSEEVHGKDVVRGHGKDPYESTIHVVEYIQGSLNGYKVMNGFFLY